MQNLLLADLVVDLPPPCVCNGSSPACAHFSCGAVALLQLEEDHLRPVAVDGLTQDAGPALRVQQHPRLAPSWRVGASPASITTAPCPTRTMA